MSTKSFPGRYKTAEYSLDLPLSKTKVIYRGYNIADERTLIAAISAKNEDKEFYVSNTLKIVQDAVLNDVDVRKLPAVDVRYLLLHQRSKSVSEDLDFTYKDERINLNIKQIYVLNERTDKDYKIKVDDEFGILMKDLTFEDEVMSSVAVKEQNKNDLIYLMLLKSVKAIYNQDEVWTVGQEISPADAEAFILSIPSTQGKPLYEFIASMPVLAADYINSKGEKQTLTNREIDFLASASHTSQSSTTTE